MARKVVAIICGTRPEAIKLAPVYLELKRRGDFLEPLLWLTGQHQEMLEQVMSTFQLVADKNFSLMRRNQSLTQITTAVLSSLDKAFEEVIPDLILVQGDTTTSMAASLAAFYYKIQVGHIEAGLRTNNKFSPFPEEINRRLTSKLADYHFAPTLWAKNNLLREAVSEDRIWVTGNTVIDALDYVVAKVRTKRPKLADEFPLDAVKRKQRLVVITGHRRENFGQGFKSICQAIAMLAEKYSDAVFVYPVHLNPNVQQPVYSILGGKPNIFLIEPLEYESFVWMMDQAYFILSDSGGVQEEAPHLGKPVLVMRDTTERPEAIEAGTAKLVGTQSDVIIREASQLFEDETVYASMSMAKNPYGDGRASVAIVDTLSKFLQAE